MILEQFVDFTFLKHDRDGLLNFLAYANTLEVAAICVYPEAVLLAKETCKHRIATVINFPEGDHDDGKIEHQLSQSQAADELDIVFPYQQFIAGRQNDAFKKMNNILALCPENKIIKIIVESGAFQNIDALKMVCEFLITQPIHFLKTSTGKIDIGAAYKAAEVILSALQNTTIGFKASGGIRSKEQAHSYYDLAAKYLPLISPDNFRLGMSAMPK